MNDLIKTKIVGVTYCNEDGTLRQDIISELTPNEPLHLVDMSTDEHPEAIGVFDLADQQCGFLSKALTADIRESGKDFTLFDVYVIEVTGGDGFNYGCNIEISVNDVSFHKAAIKQHTITPDKSDYTHIDSTTNAKSRTPDRITIACLILLAVLLVPLIYWYFSFWFIR